MAQLPCIGLYKPCNNLPFGDCAMYFDHGVCLMYVNLHSFTYTVYIYTHII